MRAFHDENRKARVRKNMTREEAIRILKDCELNPCVPEDKEAANMAIKALEQEPILDKIRAELHATAEMHEDGDYYLRDEWIFA